MSYRIFSLVGYNPEIPINPNVKSARAFSLLRARNKYGVYYWLDVSYGPDGNTAKISLKPTGNSEYKLTTALGKNPESTYSIPKRISRADQKAIDVALALCQDSNLKEAYFKILDTY